MIGDQIITAMAVGAAAGLASAPHCAAMCGPVTAAVCRRSQQRAAPLRYQVGRLLGYGLSGVVAAQFGLALSAALPQGVAPLLFSALTALSCLLLAGQLWPRAVSTAGSSIDVPLADTYSRPGLRRARRGPRLGALLRRAAGLLPRDALQVGMLSAMLPCGALAGALLLSGRAGSAPLGGATMVAFAAVSGVSLWLLGRVAGWLNHVQYVAVRRGLSLALVGLALLSAAAPLRTHGGATAGRDQAGAPAASPCH